METAHSFVPRLKRKCDDDLVVDLLNNVSLSPHKRLRQDTGLPTILEECPNLAPSADLHEEMGVSPPPEIDFTENLPELPAICPENERAIVLYKPVNPPLFPGGPRAGSPIKLTASAFATGMLDASNLLSVSNSFEELPKLGAVGNSCPVSSNLEDSEGSMVTEATRDDRLAVIPWLPNSITLPAARSNALLVDEMAYLKAGAENMSRNVDEMPVECALDSEAMEEDIELGMDGNTPRNKPVLNFGNEPWQHYGLPQQQYGSVMWSH